MKPTVDAEAGDTLCRIAIANGFKDCRPLRALPENKSLLGRDLVPGEKVHLPETQRKEDDGADGKRHTFARASVPLPGLRFIRDQTKGENDAKEKLDNLEVSNFTTIYAGDSGGEDFPTKFGFDEHAAHDPDAFKVEVSDPGAKKKIIKVKLRALRPRYGPDGKAAGHSPFATSDAAWRESTVECERLSSSPVRFRSRYLRLVTDEHDLAALSGIPGSLDDPVKKKEKAQALFVSDCVDGQGGENDATEILDQKVEARYPLEVCTFKDSTQCTAQEVVPVGTAAEQERIKLAIHVFREKPGSQRLVGGLKKEVIRKRVMKWVRRVYAQAHRAPKLVDPFIAELDPPPANMLVIGDPQGTPAFGTMLDHGHKRASTVTLKVTASKSGGAGGSATGGDTKVTMQLKANMSPAEVAEALAKELNGHGFTSRICANPAVAVGAGHSCDLFIEKAGHRVEISEAKTDDKTNLTDQGEKKLGSALEITVAKVDLNQVRDGTDNTESRILRHPDVRRIFRSAKLSDDRIDVFVIGGFPKQSVQGSVGVKQQQGTSQFFHLGLLKVAKDMAPPADMRGAVIVAAAVMDDTDFSPFTLAHEMGHVLFETGHTVEREKGKSDKPDPAETELMRDGETGGSNNSVAAPKRICDEPLLISYALNKPSAKSPFDTQEAVISAVKHLKDPQSRSVFEGWLDDPWKPPQGGFPSPGANPPA